MKLDRVVLENTARFAMDEMLKSSKDPHKSHEEHLALCWIEGLIRALSKEGKKIIIKGN